jgi:Flp pilus assembly protein TadG
MVRLRRHGRGQLTEEGGHVKDEKGMAMVEFALVLPILLLVIVGVVDFGKAFGFKNDLTHLANTAGRYATVNSSPNGLGANKIADYVKGTAPNDLQTAGGSATPVTITFTFPETPVAPVTTNHCAGDPVTVTVQTTYSWFGLSLANKVITASSTVRLEKKYDEAVPANNAYTATHVIGPATACTA